MIVYKVVYREKYKLISACEREYPITYIPGEWAVPEIGKIFCFDKLENAKKFANRCYVDMEIWKAEIRTPSDSQYFCCMWADEYDSFWNGVEQVIDTFSTPEGTVVCDSLKLLSKEILE